MNDYTADSVKSLEGVQAGLVGKRRRRRLSEALTCFGPRSGLRVLSCGSVWNPRHKKDPVDSMFRAAELPTGAVVVVKANWRDNPWFTAELEQERLDCLRLQPDKYDHIWEGGYEQVHEGAYFAKAP